MRHAIALMIICSSTLAFAQPEPRPYPKSGRNEIQYRPVVVMA